MHHRCCAAVADRATDGGDVGDVADDEGPAESGLAMSSRQVVVDHDIVTGLTQRLRGVTADVACAAGDEDDVAGVSGQRRNRWYRRAAAFVSA
ncbi:hypothetical protein D3C83_16370 [compost metagenome]